MRTPLTCPDDDDALYLARGGDVDAFRPLFQGDVIRGVEIAGYPEDDHHAVAVLQHPCTMRRGPRLRDRVAVVPVRGHAYVRPDRWATTHTQIFPLPFLDLDTEIQHAAGFFDEPGTIEASTLMAGDRVGQLTPSGVMLFQQRHVYAGTHTVVGVDTLADYSAPALTEAELQADWCMELAESRTDVTLEEAIEVENAAFHEFIRPLQGDLEDATLHADVRIKVRAEIGRRKARNLGADEAG